jgi:hypothetical protein
LVVLSENDGSWQTLRIGYASHPESESFPAPTQG